MIIFRDFPSPVETDGITHVCIGFFDGLHRGHLEVIHTFGKNESLSGTCLMSFWPHPQAILYPQSAPRLLMGLEHKLDSLQQLGVAHTLIVPFDDAFASQSADEFLSSLGNSFPTLQRLSVGMNFRFGHRREGTPDVLREWCRKHSVRFRCPALVRYGDETISSSRIREAIKQGRLREAGEMLGHDYEIYGNVIEGDGRGRQLGFPTANLEVGQILLPPAGVYGGSLNIDGRDYACAVHIGPRPTVDSMSNVSQTHVEVHILDYDGDLYGQPLKVRPKMKLREMIKFDSLTELVAQIKLDVEQVRNLL